MNKKIITIKGACFILNGNHNGMGESVRKIFDLIYFS